MRGDIYELLKPKDAMGHEQQGERYCIVIQSSNLPLSTWVVCPTSASAPPQPWRPEIEVNGKTTRIMTEQMAAVTPTRLGKFIGTLPYADLHTLEIAIKDVLDLP